MNDDKGRKTKITTKIHTVPRTGIKVNVYISISPYLPPLYLPGSRFWWVLGFIFHSLALFPCLSFHCSCFWWKYLKKNWRKFSRLYLVKEEDLFGFSAVAWTWFLGSDLVLILRFWFIYLVYFGKILSIVIPFSLYSYLVLDYYPYLNSYFF